MGTLIAPVLAVVNNTVVHLEYRSLLMLVSQEKPRPGWLSWRILKCTEESAQLLQRVFWKVQEEIMLSLNSVKPVVLVAKPDRWSWKLEPSIHLEYHRNLEQRTTSKLDETHRLACEGLHKQEEALYPSGPYPKKGWCFAMIYTWWIDRLWNTCEEFSVFVLFSFYSWLFGAVFGLCPGFEPCALWPARQIFGR